MRTEAEVIAEIAVNPPDECNCDLRVGDVVTFTNEAGLVFPGKVIIGFAWNTSFYGRVIYTSGDAYWFPSKLSEIELEAGQR